MKRRRNFSTGSAKFEPAKCLALHNGSLLILTLWLVTILSVLAVAIGRYLSLEVRLAKYRKAKEQAAALARSGVYLAMQRVVRDAAAPEAGGRAYDWMGDEWAAPEAIATQDEGSGAGGQLTVAIADEAGKLPLNTADQEQLARLTGDELLAQRLVDARDPPDAPEDAPERTPPYFAKNAPFVAPEEVSDVPDMTPPLYDVLTTQTSPYAPAAEPMNLNTVSSEVLRAVGLSERAVQLVLQYREGPDGPDAHEQDGVFQEGGVAILQTLKDQQGVDLTGTADGNRLISSLFDVSSQTFTVVSEATLARPSVRVRVTAVIRRAGCPDNQPVCLVAWRES